LSLVHNLEIDEMGAMLAKTTQPLDTTHPLLRREREQTIDTETLTRVWREYSTALHEAFPMTERERMEHGGATNYLDKLTIARVFFYVRVKRTMPDIEALTKFRGAYDNFKKDGEGQFFIPGSGVYTVDLDIMDQISELIEGVIVEKREAAEAATDK
jgi:hypothetical protein